MLMMKLCDLKRPNRTVNSFRKVKKMTLISMSTFCMLPALKMTYDPYQRENLWQLPFFALCPCAGEGGKASTSGILLAGDMVTDGL